ncbi:hypothetical protein NQ318_021782 [Aromia moschata]|uniref:Uncharacterized protein n=1 Tax=Aromia moschata TaxID=1265417 RepID=A0AAV8Z7U1_9CUCU|nr:hypothetical protein NQ318_021782 [Aromia moschata]
MYLQNLIKRKILQSCTNRNLSSDKAFQKSVQVCILGAHTPLGRSTSFLLKQNPLLSVLRVQGEQSVKNLGVDLSFIDTRCKVQTYEGILEVSKAVRKKVWEITLLSVNAGKHSPIPAADSDGLISHPRLQQKLGSGEGEEIHPIPKPFLQCGNEYHLMNKYHRELTDSAHTITLGKEFQWSADIVVILGTDDARDKGTMVDRIMCEGKRIHDITKVCTVSAPRSVILVCVKPVSFSTVLVEEVFKGTHWYHPGRIIGSSALAQVKANTLLGRYQDLDPRICNVPIIGGPDIDLAVPLFSRASPVELTDKVAYN